MTQVAIGPGLSRDEESWLRRGQLAVALTEAERAAEVIEQKIAGMQEALQGRRDEIARLRAELED